MAEIATRTPSPIEPVAVTPAPQTISPVQALAESSVVDYAKPQTVTPAPTTTQTITTAATPTSVTARPAPTQPILETKPKMIDDLMSTRPTTQTNNILMIDPSLGIGTGLGKESTSSGGGGGGGGGSMSEDAPAGVAKKSWWPVILIVTGLVVIGSKLIKKKAE